MTRAIWVDAGNDLDYTKARALTITEPYFDIRDKRITTNYLLALKAQNYAPGLYACWNWPETKDLTGKAFAEWVSAKIGPLPQYPDFPKVHLNAETKERGYIAAMLKRWRELRPKRVTLWTMEGHQAPVYAPIAEQIRAANVAVGPQCYVGNMERIESAGEVATWAQLVPVERIVPFLDAAQLGAWWTGCAFSQGRLPA